MPGGGRVRIDIIKEIGHIVERRAPQDRRKSSKNGKKQTSYCYVCKVQGIKGDPTFSNNEIDRGFQIKRAPISEVVKLFTDAFKRKDQEIYGAVKTILERDLLFLEEAAKIIDTKK